MSVPVPTSEGGSVAGGWNRDGGSAALQAVPREQEAEGELWRSVSAPVVRNRSKWDSSAILGVRKEGQAGPMVCWVRTPKVSPPGQWGPCMEMRSLQM